MKSEVRKFKINSARKAIQDIIDSVNDITRQVDEIVSVEEYDAEQYEEEKEVNEPSKISRLIQQEEYK